MRRIALGVAALALLGACRHAAPATAAASSNAAPDEGAVGDSARFGARIVRLAPQRAEARFRIGRPAYVVLVTVRPGVGVEAIAPDPLDPRPAVRRHAGTFDAPITPAGSVSASARVAVGAENVPAYAREAYAACVPRTVRPASTRRVRRAVARDASGRPVDGGPSEEEVAVRGVTEEDAAAICARQVRTMAAPNMPRDGYLLLLVSDAPMSGVELAERLATLKVPADGPRRLMREVAETIYAGANAPWSGYYRRW